MQGYAIPHRQCMAQSIPPPRIVTVLGKAHDHGQGRKPECTRCPASNIAVYPLRT